MAANFRYAKYVSLATIFMVTCAGSEWAVAGNKEFLSVKGESADPVGLVDPAACIPQNQFIVLSPAATGQDHHKEPALGFYERISPDGRFVMRSLSGEQLSAVTLVELPPPSMAAVPQPIVKIYQTPFSNEAFPVQGTWRYLVDTNGDHYQFSSILLHQRKAQPLFRGGMTEFYAAASEMPGNAPGRIAIRSMSWPNATGNSDTQGQGMLTTRTLQIDLATQKPVADSGTTELCTDRVGEDGFQYALPMISVDGTEFAALPQNPPPAVGVGESRAPSMRIFGFGTDGKGCEPRAQFAFASGKITFGYPPASLRPPSSDKDVARPDFLPSTGGADAAYEYRAQVYWYDRALGRSFNLAPYSDKPGLLQLASAFPGITHDGRVIYAATWRDCSATQAGEICPSSVGYVIADPYQSNDYVNWLGTFKGKARRQCIRYGEVLREREAFAKFHGIAP